MKKIKFLSLVFAFLFVFTACTGTAVESDTESDTLPVTEEPTPKEELTVQTVILNETSLVMKTHHCPLQRQKNRLYVDKTTNNRVFKCLKNKKGSAQMRVLPSLFGAPRGT